LVAEQLMTRKINPDVEMVMFENCSP